MTFFRTLCQHMKKHHEYYRVNQIFNYNITVSHVIAIECSALICA